MTVESYGFKFVVDAKDAAKGYGDFQKAVDGVFSSLTKFEAHAKKVMDSITSSSKRGQGDIAKYANQFKSLGNIPIDGRAAPALFKLSEAMRSFKAPNTTQIANLRSFFKSLGTIPDIANATRSISNISKLNAAMAGLKVPSGSQSARLVEFAKAMTLVGPGLSSLRSVSGVSSVANELASISLALQRLKIPSRASISNLGNLGLALQQMKLGNLSGASHLFTALNAINGFKAPSAAQVRNLQLFINAVGTLKVPNNAGQIATYLNQIAAAATAANSNLKGFRGSLNGISWGKFNSGAHSARLELMGLQNAFSGTFQIGSVLRSLLGSLTIGELGREFFDATQAMNQFQASMEVISEAPGFKEQMWERISAMANKFGADLTTLSGNFANFAIASKEAGASTQQTLTIFEGFQTAMTALHLSKDKMDGVGLALKEMMNKGFVSSQQLTRQLDMYLPGAMSVLNRAVKEASHGTETVFDALKRKQIDSTQALLLLADYYKRTFGPSVKQALESPTQQFTILKNHMMEFMIAIGNAGAKKGFADFLAKLSGYLNPADMQRYADVIGNKLSKALDKASSALDYLYQNWDRIKGPLSSTLTLIGRWMTISSGLQIGRALVSPILSAQQALVRFTGTLNGGMTSLRGAQGAFAGIAAGIQPLPRGLASLNVGLVASTAASNSLTVASNVLSRAQVGLRATGSAIASLFGGPFGLALTAAAAAAYYLYDQISSVHAVMNDVQPSINKTSDLLQTLGYRALTGATQAKHLGDEHGAAVPHILKFAGATGTAADQLYRLADAQRKANIEQITGKINQLRDEKDTIYHNSREGLSADFNKPVTSVGQFLGNLKRGIGAGLDSAISFGQSDRDKTAKMGQLDTAIQQAQRRLDDYRKRPLESEVTPGMRETIGGAQYDPNHLLDADAGKHDKKKKKGPTERQLMERNENAVTEMMKDLLDQGDPFDKLFTDFVQHLTKEGQVLLQDKSFKQFINNMNADAQTGKVSVESLIHALQSGGIKPKVLDDLKKRYHTDVNGIIHMLREEQDAYEEHVKDATVKQIQKQNKFVDDVMRRMAEDDPILKVMRDFTDDLSHEAQDLLSADAFAKWFRETAENADGAATATQRLITALQTAGGINPKNLDALKARGMSVDTIIGGLRHSDATKDLNLRQKKEEMQVGTLLLRQEQQELQFATMSERQQTVANKLLDEFNRQLGLKHVMTQQELDDLKAKLFLDQRQIETMNQQREFFENNGIHKYVQDLKSAGEAVHDLDYNFLRNMEDTLYNLGTTGKLSFKSLLNGIQSDLIHFAAQGLTRSFLNIISPGSDKKQNPSIFGGLFKAMGFDTSFKAKPELGTMSNPMMVTVTNAGALQFGQGAFGTGSPLDSNGPMNDSDLLNWMLGGSPTGTNVSGQNPVQNTIQEGAKGAIPSIIGIFTGAFKSVGGIFKSIFGAILGGLGGAGKGIGGLLGSVLGGGSGGGGGTSPLDDLSLLTDLGIFKEGGYSNTPVSTGRMALSAFFNAPHYAEGTANTSGGTPAVLHDNEAVIPLSRGRKVPVELTNGGSNANGTVINNNFTVNSPDADSFRRSQNQIATELHVAGARAWARNCN